VTVEAGHVPCLKPPSNASLDDEALLDHLRPRDSMEDEASAVLQWALAESNLYHSQLADDPRSHSRA